jgi:DNA-binding beta-propeller fold protein YncE
MLFGSNKHTYELKEGWARCPEGWSFPDVCGISVDSKDNVYVFSRSDHPVSVFDREGNLQNWWGAGMFKSPHGIYVDPTGNLFLVDDADHAVYKFSADGKLLMTLGHKGQPSDTGYSRNPKIAVQRSGPPFNRPTKAVLSATGEILVSDGYGNARIHKFWPDGRLLSSWGEPGTGPGQFRTPHSVLEDRLGRIWVTDRENNRIQIFDARGKFISQWTDLVRPTETVIDGEGSVYVSELSHRVSIFTFDGKLLARWGSQGEDEATALFVSPHTIAVDSRGDVYTGEVSFSDRKLNRGLKALKKFVRKPR